MIEYELCIIIHVNKNYLKEIKWKTIDMKLITNKQKTLVTDNIRGMF